MTGKNIDPTALNAASQTAPDCYQPELVAAELHRSFPDAGDGRPMPPMGDDLMTAGLSADDARFVAVQLAQNGLMLVASQPAQPVAVKIKPMVWSKRYGMRVIKMTASSSFGDYHIDVFYKDDVDREEDIQVLYACIIFAATPLNAAFYHARFDGNDAQSLAISAVQANYEARIMAALDVQPLTVQDAARVPEIAALIEAADNLLQNYLRDELDEPDLCVDDEHWSAIHDVNAALRAIAEGRA